jgi:hypothetical protein
MIVLAPMWRDGGRKKKWQANKLIIKLLYKHETNYFISDGFSPANGKLQEQY